MNAGDALASCLVDELVRCGVEHVCVSPGSRSTPLTVAAAGDARVRTHVSIDERSAGFLAVGIARASGRPAAVVSTSGTAAANFLPAVTEASAGSVPMIVLTADRPPELRDTGANQTIDQLHLYGRFVRWFCEVGVAEDVAGAPRYWRSIACRAWAEATAGDPGPVHLNVAFREPLVDSGGTPFSQDVRGRADGRPWTQTSPGSGAPSEADVEWLAERVGATERGVILAGAGEVDAPGVHALAVRAGWPVLAEPASGLRSGTCAISTYEALLRCGWAGDHRPDLVVRIGKLGISRVVNAFFDESIDQVLLDRAGRWLDSERAAVRIVRGDPAANCAAVARAIDERSGSAWLRAWTEAESRARGALDAVLDETEDVSEPRVARDLAALLPDGSHLVVAASMPVRDLDWFMAPRTGLRVLGNRGANGIDGFVSTVLGVALASDGPTFALAGDLSMLHDQNGLLLARDEDVGAVFVVLNNEGGGIFSFLPQAGAVPDFERLFATPHGIDFAALADVYGCAYRRVDKAPELGAALDDPVSGVRIAEVRTDRNENVELHRRLWAAVAGSLR